MAAVEQSIELEVPSDWAARELSAFAYQHAVGHYHMVERELEWNQADDCETEGRVAFEPLATERTRMTVRVGYDPDEAPSCETAVSGRVTGELDEFKRFTEDHYRVATEETGRDVA